MGFADSRKTARQSLESASFAIGSLKIVNNIKND